MVEEGQNQPKIPTKSIKLHEIMKKGEEDRISLLPDCLLLEILSHLPSTKEAIKTGTLSKPWKHIWTLIPTLIFEHSDHNLPWSTFVSFVDKPLIQCRQLKLRKFEVYTSYTGFESQVNSWIRHAIGCDVEELNLALWNMERDAEFLLDQYFCSSSCYTNLRLAGCMFNPTGTISWKHLKSLCISSGNLDKDLIKNMLCGSPVLETLVLNDCYGFKLLDITSKSAKKLVFCGYMAPIPDDEFDDLNDVIKINAPNIKSLTIQGSLLLSEFLLVNVASLVEANLDYINVGHCETTEEEMLKGFILKLHHVKELKIGIICSKVLSRLEAKGFVIP